MTQEVTLYPDQPPQETLPSPAPPASKPPKPTKTTSSSERPTIRLTPRDFAILTDLLTARYMTASQLQALYWTENRGGTNGQITAARHRLKLLHDIEIIRRIIPLVQQYVGGKSELLYALDKAGAQIVAERLGIDLATIDYKPHDREANWPFLQHLLDTTNVRIALTQAAAARGLMVAYWYNELELRQVDLCDVISITDPNGTEHKAAIVPDALFCLLNAAGKQAPFMVEIDRRTVTVEPSNWAQRGWMRKVQTATAYFESDAYKQRYGDVVVHALTITTGDVRLAHLKQATEKVTTSKRFWFTTFDQLTAETALSDPIWQRANMEGVHFLLSNK